MTKRSTIILLAIAGTVALGGFAVLRGARAGVGAASGPKPAAPRADLADRPLAESRLHLLDLAFRTASALPSNPHLKTRSRLQESVVRAALELDRPQKAAEFAARIDNWRRGSALADYATHCAAKGAGVEAERALRVAAQVADESLEKGAQQWQIAQIRMKIAAALSTLGRTSDAETFAAGVVDPETGRSEFALPAVLVAKDFETKFATVEKVLAGKDFDQVRGALETAVLLYDACYAEKPRREQIESTVRLGWARLPVQVRIEIALDLAAAAVRHDDRARAVASAAEARTLLDGSPWMPESQVPLAAQIAAARYRAGDVETARAELDRALAYYRAERARIVDIFRADALLPVAEAYVATGNRTLALEVYREIAEEGVQNPNSRPRAEDLTALCLSLATTGFEIDAALTERIVAISDRLGDPW